MMLTCYTNPYDIHFVFTHTEFVLVKRLLCRSFFVALPVSSAMINSFKYRWVL